MKLGSCLVNSNTNEYGCCNIHLHFAMEMSHISATQMNFNLQLPSNYGDKLVFSVKK